MRKISISFQIKSGPKHIFDLALCLIDPEPGRGINSFKRCPDFKIDTNGMFEHYPKPRNPKLDELLDFVSCFGDTVPIRITSLSCNEIPNRWSFKGEAYNSFSETTHKKTPVSGWFNTEKQTGTLTIFERTRLTR